MPQAKGCFNLIKNLKSKIWLRIKAKVSGKLPSAPFCRTSREEWTVDLSGARSLWAAGLSGWKCSVPWCWARLVDHHSTNPEENSAIRMYPQNTIQPISCHFIYPVQSFNLQILEKWCQKFDGMVGQYNWQNSKPLVSWQKQQWQAIN